MLNSVIDLDWTPIIDWHVDRCGSKNGYKKHVIKKDWNMCSKYDNHSKSNSQDNWEEPIQPLNKHQIFTSIMNKTFI